MVRQEDFDIDQTVKFCFVIREKAFHGLWVSNHHLTTYDVSLASQFPTKKDAADTLQHISVKGEWEVCKLEVVTSIIPV